MPYELQSRLLRTIKTLCLNPCCNGTVANVIGGLIEVTAFANATATRAKRDHCYAATSIFQHEKFLVLMEYAL